MDANPRTRSGCAVTEAGWARWPGPEADPAGTVVLEAFGRPTPAVAGWTDQEDLYSVFLAHAELMGWSALTTPRGPVGLWGMNDADLTAGDRDLRIGWVQVGLRPDVGLLRTVPPLVRCFVQALARLRAGELTGLRVNATALPPPATDAPGLWQALGWFNAGPRTPCEIRIAVESGAAGADGRDLLAYLSDLAIEPFAFGHAPAAAHPVTTAAAVTARLPEPTIAALGWALAMVIHASERARPPADTLTVAADFTNGGAAAGWSLGGE